MTKPASSLWITLSLMTAAALSVVLPLILLRNVVLVFLVYHIGFCLLLPGFDLFCLKRMRAREVLRFLGFKGGESAKAVRIGFQHGIPILVGTVIGYLWLHNAALLDGARKILVQWGANGENRWVVFFFMIVFNGVAEEILWRGYALKRLLASVRPWPAILISTLFYTSYHLATTLNFFSVNLISLSTIILIFLAGLFWGWMRVRTDSLWAPVIGHVLATIGYMLIYLML